MAKLVSAVKTNQIPQIKGRTLHKDCLIYGDRCRELKILWIFFVRQPNPNKNSLISLLPKQIWIKKGGLLPMGLLTILWEADR